MFCHVSDYVDPMIFYHVQRPLLAGFFPDGISFAGTQTIDKPNDWISCPKGPSAGQSTMFVLLDIILGIDHSVVAKEFQEEVLNYMPRQHREMVIKFKEKLSLSVRDFIKGNIKYILLCVLLILYILRKIIEIYLFLT